MIKDKSLIAKRRKLLNGHEYILKKDNPSAHNRITKLGDVFRELPNGLVYKEETGMGATHLELITNRNSPPNSPPSAGQSSLAQMKTSPIN